MKARRLGRVFTAEDGPSWMVSHAAYPTPIQLSSDRIRVYFNARDAEGRGQLAWVDVDAADPRRVLDVSEAPALSAGEVGTFDDRGLSNGSMHWVGDRLWLYYMGWNRATDTPFRNAIGLAVSDGPDGLRFAKRFEGAVVDRSRFDPVTLSYPFVTPGGQGAPWSMLYGTSRAGGVREEVMRHVLTEARSADGEDWRPTGENVVGLEAGEYGLSRPWRVDAEGGAYLLYSIRRAQYSIGVSAFDRAAGRWRRVDGDLLGPSPDAWDSDASCYAAVIAVRSARYMFYCGNGYGRTGFGVAALET